MKNLFQILLIAATLFLMSSCYYDNKEELYAAYNEPENTTLCDSFSPAYSGNLKDLFDTRCVSCHGQGSGHTALLYDFTTAAAASAQFDLEVNASDAGHNSTFTLTPCEKARLRIWDNNPLP